MNIKQWELIQHREGTWHSLCNNATPLPKTNKDMNNESIASINRWYISLGRETITTLHTWVLHNPNSPEPFTCYSYREYLYTTFHQSLL